MCTLSPSWRHGQAVVCVPMCFVALCRWQVRDDVLSLLLFLPFCNMFVWWFPTKLCMRNEIFHTTLVLFVHTTISTQNWGWKRCVKMRKCVKCANSHFCARFAQTMRTKLRISTLFWGLLAQKCACLRIPAQWQRITALSGRGLVTFTYTSTMYFDETRRYVVKSRSFGWEIMGIQKVALRIMRISAHFSAFSTKECKNLEFLLKT